MANYDTTLSAKADLTGAAGLTDPTLYQGNVRYMFTTLNVLTAMAAADTFDIGPALPAGARVLPHLSRFLCHADPGTTLTIDIGDASDADRFCDGAVLSNGGEVVFCSAAIPAGVTTPVKYTTATELKGLIASAGTLTNNTKIDILIAYTVG
jgi:hypothetical protein